MFTVGLSSSPFEARLQEFAAHAVSVRPKDPHTAIALERLAFIYMQSGRYAAADLAYDDALKIMPSDVGPDLRLLRLRMLNSSAFVKANLGYAREASSVFETVKERFPLEVVDSLPDSFIDVSHYAANLQFQGYDELAADVLKQLNAKLDSIVISRLDVFKTRMNLANILSLTGNYDAAQHYLALTKEMLKADFDDEHNLPEWLNLAGLNEYRKGEPNRAKPHFVKAKKNALELFGSKSEQYTVILSNAALNAAVLGDVSSAAEDIQAAVSISNEIKGETFARILNIQGYLAINGIVEDDPLETFEEALAIRKRSLGTEHPHYAYVLNNIGSFYKKSGDLAEAKIYFADAQAIASKRLRPDHPILRSIDINLASLSNPNYVASRVSAQLYAH